MAKLHTRLAISLIEHSSLYVCNIFFGGIAMTWFFWLVLSCVDELQEIVDEILGRDYAERKKTSRFTPMAFLPPPPAPQVPAKVAEPVLYEEPAVVEKVVLSQEDQKTIAIRNIEINGDVFCPDEYCPIDVSPAPAMPPFKKRSQPQLWDEALNLLQEYILALSDGSIAQAEELKNQFFVAGSDGYRLVVTVEKILNKGFDADQEGMVFFWDQGKKSSSVLDEVPLGQRGQSFIYALLNKAKSEDREKPVKNRVLKPISVDPESIEHLLIQGWKIHKEVGRQVILVKDGKSVTRYRPESASNKKSG